MLDLIQNEFKVELPFGLIIDSSDGKSNRKWMVIDSKLKVFQFLCDVDRDNLKVFKYSEHPPYWIYFDEDIIGENE